MSVTLTPRPCSHAWVSEPASRQCFMHPWPLPFLMLCPPLARVEFVNAAVHRNESDETAAPGDDKDTGGAGSMSPAGHLHGGTAVRAMQFRYIDHAFRCRARACLASAPFHLHEWGQHGYGTLVCPHGGTQRDAVRIVYCIRLVYGLAHSRLTAAPDVTVSIVNSVLLYAEGGSLRQVLGSNRTTNFCYLATISNASPMFLFCGLARRQALRSFLLAWLLRRNVVFHFTHKTEPCDAAIPNMSIRTCQAWMESVTPSMRKFRL